MNNTVLSEDEEHVLKLLIQDYEDRIKRHTASYPFKNNESDRKHYLSLKSKLGM